MKFRVKCLTSIVGLVLFPLSLSSQTLPASIPALNGVTPGLMTPGTLSGETGLELQTLKKTNPLDLAQNESDTAPLLDSEGKTEETSFYDTLSDIERAYFNTEIQDYLAQTPPPLRKDEKKEKEPLNLLEEKEEYEDFDSDAWIKQEGLSGHISDQEKHQLGKEKVDILIAQFKNKLNGDIIELNKSKVVYQYGYDLFKKRFKANPSTNLPVNPNYRVGPNDTLLIRVWGKIEESFLTTLDKNGNIYLPKVGYISLNQVKFKHLNSIIEKALSKHYVNFDLSVTMQKLRSIKIFILGEIHQPGSYDISSLSTVINALYQADGPTKKGSLRTVKLIRKNGKTQTIDLYSYIMKGDQKKDIQLQNNDTIFVPPIKNVVKISGSVIRPGIYEFTSQLSIRTLIQDLAGGYAPDAFKELVQIHRNDKKSRVLLDINNKKLGSTMVQNGDSVTVSKINDNKTNEISITGSVWRPGTYEYKPNMTLQTLINQAEGVQKSSVLTLIKIFRYQSSEKQELLVVDYTKTPEFKLMPLDRVEILSEKNYFGKKFVQIKGAVQNPGEYELLDNMTLSDLVILAEPQSYAELNHAELFRNVKGKEQLFNVSIKALLNNPLSEENITLEENDFIFIKTTLNANKYKKIIISGEVRFPGEYLARENETLISIIQRAGGVTKKAFLDGGLFYRKSVKNLEISGNKKILSEEQKRLIFDQRKEKDANSLLFYKEAITFLENKIEESSGRISISLKDILDKKASLQLEDGDTLHIPEIPTTIQVVGGVQQTTSTLYVKKKPVSFYINKAGGYSEFAKKRKVYIFKANGEIRLNEKIVEAGDTIYVPEKPTYTVNWLEITSSISKILFNIISVLKITDLIQ